MKMFISFYFTFIFVLDNNNCYNYNMKKNNVNIFNLINIFYNLKF